MRAAGSRLGGLRDAIRFARVVTIQCRRRSADSVEVPRWKDAFSSPFFWLSGALRLAGAVRQAGPKPAPVATRRCRPQRRLARPSAAGSTAARSKPAPPTPAPAASDAGRRRSGAGLRVETRRRDRRLHQSRRPAEELAAEALSGPARASRSRWWCTNFPRSQPLPFSLRVPTSATTRTLNSALYAVRGAPVEGQRHRRPICGSSTSDSSGPARRKEFHFDPSSYMSTFKASVDRAGRPAAPVTSSGARAGRHRENGRIRSKPGGAVCRGRKVSAAGGQRHRGAADATRATSSSPASTTTTS